VDITLLPGFNPGPYTGAGNNTYLLHGPVPTLIDAGTGRPEHLSALAEALGGATLAQVLVTHAHPDHADGCDSIAARWPRAVFRKLPWPERDRLQGVSCESVSDDDLVDAGTGRLRALHTPGHAPDHLCFFDEASRTLFSADLVIPGSSVVIPASRGGSLAAYLDSLRRVLRLAPDRMLPAHGAAIGDPVGALTGYLEHRQQREDQIVGVLGAGRRHPETIVDRLYEGLAPALKTMARESVTAHLVKLRDEGRVRSVGDEWELA
jgi:glyoxylase-like metal-dependent hydrolase (beta-lactamase superfamily II)